MISFLYFVGLYRISAFFVSGVRPDIRFHLPDLRLTGYLARYLTKLEQMMRTSNKQTFFFFRIFDKSKMATWNVLGFV